MLLPTISISKVRKATLASLCSCVFGFYERLPPPRRANTACSQRSDVFVWKLHPDGLWDSAVCRAHYLIRMNFSNNPLLAGVDQRPGRQRRGRKFYYFPAASVFLASIVNSIFWIVSITEPLFYNKEVREQIRKHYMPLQQYLNY